MTENKVAIVTAAGQGMGAAIAKELSASGYSLALMSPSGAAEELAKSLGALGLKGSVTELDDLQRLVNSTMDRCLLNLSIIRLEAGKRHERAPDAQPIAHHAMTARQKAIRQPQHDVPFHQIVRHRTSHPPCAGFAAARRPHRIPTARTNGCASYLEVDPSTGVARCPICGYVRRTNYPGRPRRRVARRGIAARALTATAILLEHRIARGTP